MNRTAQLLMCGKPCPSCNDDYQSWETTEDGPFAPKYYAVSCTSCGMTFLFRAAVVDDPTPLRDRW